MWSSRSVSTFSTNQCGLDLLPTATVRDAFVDEIEPLGFSADTDDDGEEPNPHCAYVSGVGLQQDAALSVHSAGEPVRLLRETLLARRAIGTLKRMGSPARRDDLLEQIRALPIEDREYIEAALMREAYDQGRRTDSPDELDEIKRRAVDALSGRNPSYSREDSVARARAAVESIRSRKR